MKKELSLRGTKQSRTMHNKKNTSHAELVSASHQTGHLSREILKQVQDDMEWYLRAIATLSNDADA